MGKSYYLSINISYIETIAVDMGTNLYGTKTVYGLMKLLESESMGTKTFKMGSLEDKLLIWDNIIIQYCIVYIVVDKAAL